MRVGIGHLGIWALGIGHGRRCSRPPPLTTTSRPAHLHPLFAQLVPPPSGDTTVVGGAGYGGYVISLGVTLFDWRKAQPFAGTMLVESIEAGLAALELAIFALGEVARRYEALGHAVGAAEIRHRRGYLDSARANACTLAPLASLRVSAQPPWPRCTPLPPSAPCPSLRCAARHVRPPPAAELRALEQDAAHAGALLEAVSCRRDSNSPPCMPPPLSGPAPASAQCAATPPSPAHPRPRLRPQVRIQEEVEVLFGDDESAAVLRGRAAQAVGPLLLNSLLEFERARGTEHPVLPSLRDALESQRHLDNMRRSHVVGDAQASGELPAVLAEAWWALGRGPNRRATCIPLPSNALCPLAHAHAPSSPTVGRRRCGCFLHSDHHKGAVDGCVSCIAACELASW